MDFSNIPFDSALDQLSQLLPIGTFIRLQTVVPNSQKVSLVKRYFHKITVERSSTAFLSMTFEDINGETKFTVRFDSPEAVLNEGPVECESLELYRAEGVPVEAIACNKEMRLALATPAVLPFLACNAINVFFLWKEADGCSQTFVTFEEVLTHLGANVKYLEMPWLATSDSAEITHFKMPQNKDFRFSCFEMPFSTFEQLKKWLRKNAHALAHQRFCEIAILRCLHHEIKDAEEEDLNLSARPYCSHQFDSICCLNVYFSNMAYTFFFNPGEPCRHC